VRDGGELFHVINVCAADIGVEKHGIAVAALSPHEVVEVLAYVLKRFRSPGFSLIVSTAKLTVAMPASARRSVTSGRKSRAFVAR